MRLAARLNRIELAAHTKLQGLLTPKAILDARGVMIAGMLDYIGLPRDDDEKAKAFRYEIDEQLARRMLVLGVDRKTAHISWYAERSGITEDEAREWLKAGHAIWREAEQDRRAGVPYEQSGCAAQVREMLTSESVDYIRQFLSRQRDDHAKES